MAKKKVPGRKSTPTKKRTPDVGKQNTPTVASGPLQVSAQGAIFRATTG